MASTWIKTSQKGVYINQEGRFKVRAAVRCQETGKVLQKTKVLESGCTMGDALVILHELKAQFEFRDQPRKLQPTITVADYAEQWFADKSMRLRRGTASTYEVILSEHILPELGHVPLQDITRRDVERWLARIEKKTKPGSEKLYSNDTLKGWYRVLRSLLRDAAAEFSLTDPTNRVRPPGRRQLKPVREKRTLDSEQMRGFLEAAQKLVPKRYPEILMLALTGMRSGELWALAWEDIDNLKGVVHIRHSVSGGILNPTKTVDPRTVVLSAPLKEALREHKRAAMASGKLVKEIVFPSEKGTYRHHNSLNKALGVCASAIRTDIRIRPQVLRRTFNSLMIREGIDRIVLRSIMGHCNEEMTERYAWVDNASKHSAVESLTARLL